MTPASAFRRQCSTLESFSIRHGSSPFSKCIKFVSTYNSVSERNITQCFGIKQAWIQTQPNNSVLPHVYNETWTWINIAALCSMEKHRKQPKCPSLKKCTAKLEYYIRVKRSNLDVYNCVQFIKCLQWVSFCSMANAFKSTPMQQCWQCLLRTQVGFSGNIP